MPWPPVVPDVDPVLNDVIEAREAESTQALEEEAPAWEVEVPDAHAIHEPTLVEPIDAPHLPMEQGVQELVEFAPEVLLHLPAGQLAH